MAIVNPHEVSFNKESIVIRCNLVLLNDSFEIRLPFPVRVVTGMERALGSTVATTTVTVSATNIMDSAGAGLSFQTLQTLSTLETPASVSTVTFRVLKAELTALNGTGGVEYIFVGSLN
jgi:hypothetical protein